MAEEDTLANVDLASGAIRQAHLLPIPAETGLGPVYQDLERQLQRLDTRTLKRADDSILRQNLAEYYPEADDCLWTKPEPCNRSSYTKANLEASLKAVHVLSQARVVDGAYTRLLMTFAQKLLEKQDYLLSKLRDPKDSKDRPGELEAGEASRALCSKRSGREDHVVASLLGGSCMSLYAYAEYMKAYVRVFSGQRDESLKSWLDKIHSMFDMDQITTDHQKLALASFFLEGEAQLALQDFKKQTQNGSWKEFENKLISNFRDSSYIHRIYEKLTHLRQTGPLADYIHEFDGCVYEIDDGISDCIQVYLFEKGLEPELRGRVQSFCIDEHDLRSSMNRARRLDSIEKYLSRRTCEYCHKTGHTTERCWKRKRLC